MKQSIIYLIDFFGHAAMDTDDSIDLRFSTLKDLISMHELDKNRCIFVANCPASKSQDYPIYNRLREKFLEMKRVAQLYHWTWIDSDPSWTQQQWLKTIEDQSPLCDVSPDNTQIIFGGTNTSGCVFQRPHTGLVHFAQQGYSTTLYFPLCSDPGCSGRTVQEKTIKSFSMIYNTLKKLSLFDRVDVEHRRNDLGLPVRDQ